MTPKWQKLASIAQKICTLKFQFFGAVFSSKGYPFKNILSIDEMVGALCFGCCQAHLGLPVGFILLQYSVLFTVESLSLLYLPSIS